MKRANASRRRSLIFEAAAVVVIAIALVTLGWLLPEVRVSANWFWVSMMMLVGGVWLGWELRG